MIHHAAEKQYWQGRVVAASREEAVGRIISELAKRGYKPAAAVRPYPAPVQPWKNAVWWEYMAQVEGM